MNLEATILGIIGLGLTLYVLLAGADFGGGVWDLFASGVRAQEQRALIAAAIGPVWEANHVWLIFMLVVLWTGFPSAFEAIFSTLFIPLSLAALGIVLRGAGFAFHRVAARRSTSPAGAKAISRNEAATASVPPRM